MRGTESPKPVINEAGRIPMSKSLHADFVIRYRMYLGAYRDMLFLIEWVVRLRRPAPNQLMRENSLTIASNLKSNLPRHAMAHGVVVVVRCGVVVEVV